MEGPQRDRSPTVRDLLGGGVRMRIPRERSVSFTFLWLFLGFAVGWTAAWLYTFWVLQ